jgi:hypothetical protein
MKLIETITLGTVVSSITFTSIPQTFTDLVLKISSRSTGDSSGINLRINSDASTINDIRTLRGSGSVTYTDLYSNQPAIYLFDQTQSTYTANTFSNIEAYIPNYTGATFKSVSNDSVTENNGSTAGLTIAAGIYKNTNAVTSLFLLDGGHSFVVGSTFSLYGITKGSDGIVTTS